MIAKLRAGKLQDHYGSFTALTNVKFAAKPTNYGAMKTDMKPDDVAVGNRQ